MNWLDGINQVIEYIEKHLEDEIDYDKISELFMASPLVMLKKKESWLRHFHHCTLN